MSDLFEGIVIGIYGNWLISFIDKISFLREPIVLGVVFIGYQIMAVGLSFATLLILFAFSMFRPDTVTRWFGFVLGVGHVVGIFGALFAEGFTISLTVFYCIGVILFLIIYTLELRRVRMSRRKTENSRTLWNLPFFKKHGKKCVMLKFGFRVY
jgi:hypothetical protein